MRTNIELRLRRTGKTQCLILENVLVKARAVFLEFIKLLNAIEAKIVLYTNFRFIWELFCLRYL